MMQVGSIEYYRGLVQDLTNACANKNREIERLRGELERSERYVECSRKMRRLYVAEIERLKGELNIRLQARIAELEKELAEIIRIRDLAYQVRW